MMHKVEYGIVQEGDLFFLVKYVYQIDNEEKTLIWWSKVNDLLEGFDLDLLRWIMREIGNASKSEPIPLKNLPFKKFKHGEKVCNY